MIADANSFIVEPTAMPTDTPVTTPEMVEEICIYTGTLSATPQYKLPVAVALAVALVFFLLFLWCAFRPKKL